MPGSARLLTSNLKVVSILLKEKEMARGVNKEILMGHCGQDPQIKELPSGDKLVNISLATNESWKDRQTG